LYSDAARTQRDGADRHVADAHPRNGSWTAQDRRAKSLAGRWCSLCPPGWPAILAVGVLLGAPWLVDPLLLGLSIVGVWRLALYPRDEVRRLQLRFVEPGPDEGLGNRAPTEFSWQRLR
jgi:hypothetical protein